MRGDEQASRITMQGMVRKTSSDKIRESEDEGTHGTPARRRVPRSQSRTIRVSNVQEWSKTEESASKGKRERDY